MQEQKKKRESKQVEIVEYRAEYQDKFRAEDIGNFDSCTLLSQNKTLPKINEDDSK